MYTIHGKGNEIVWGKDGKLGKFKDGIIETENADIVKEFYELGYEIDGDDKMLSDLSKQQIQNKENTPPEVEPIAESIIEPEQYMAEETPPEVDELITPRRRRGQSND